MKGAFIPIGGLTSRFAVQGPLGKTGHGSGVRPMFTKQVSRPMNSVDRPSWPLGGAGRANSKKDLVTRPIRGFCALQVYVEGQSAVTASGETVGRRDLVAQMSRWSRTSSRRALPGARGWSKSSSGPSTLSAMTRSTRLAVFRRVWGRRPNPVGLQYIDKESCCTPRRSTS